MKKDKFTDTALWERMGLELNALRELIMAIHVDSDFQDIMVVKIWDRFFKIIQDLDVIRGDAEDRMYLKSGMRDTDIFYPCEHRKIDALVSGFRQRLRENSDQTNKAKLKIVRMSEIENKSGLCPLCGNRIKVESAERLPE